MNILIPTYKEPDYLDICLHSIISNANNIDGINIIVVVDGYYGVNKQTIDKYDAYINKSIIFDNNIGLSHAINVGMSYISETFGFESLTLILNDDNVVQPNYDAVLDRYYNALKIHTQSDKFFMVPNQIEPSHSIFNSFRFHDYGKDAISFSFDEFNSDSIKYNSDKVTDDGWTFPIAITPKIFQSVEGWDTTYPSPHVVDVDFFYKLQQNNISSYRIHNTHVYHFGGKATKNTDNNPDIHALKFNKLENNAMEHFNSIWGGYPHRDTVTNKIKLNN